MHRQRCDLTSTLQERRLNLNWERFGREYCVLISFFAALNSPEWCLKIQLHSSPSAAEAVLILALYDNGA
jgi:hypothetical protein